MKRIGVVAVLCLLPSVALAGLYQPVYWIEVDFSAAYNSHDTRYGPYFDLNGWVVKAQLLYPDGQVIGAPSGDLFPVFTASGDVEYLPQGILLSPTGGAFPWEPAGIGDVSVQFSFSWYDNYYIGAVIIKYQDRSWQGMFGSHLIARGGRKSTDVTLPAAGKWHRVLVNLATNEVLDFTESGGLRISVSGILYPYSTVRIHAGRLEEILVDRMFIGIFRKVEW